MHYQEPPPDPAAGVAGMFCCVMFVLLPVLLVGINVAILFWVAKDAKSRGMDGAMWIFLILFAGVIGLAIYLFSRPQGRLVQCHNCGNNRMETSMKCPHCAAGQDRRRDRYEKDEEEDEPDDDDAEYRQAHRPRKKSAAREAVVQQQRPSRPPQDDHPTLPCPYCGVRLRIPQNLPSTVYKFACPGCRKTISIGG